MKSGKEPVFRSFQRSAKKLLTVHWFSYLDKFEYSDNHKKAKTYVNNPIYEKIKHEKICDQHMDMCPDYCRNM